MLKPHINGLNQIVTEKFILCIWFKICISLYGSICMHSILEISYSVSKRIDTSFIIIFVPLDILCFFLCMSMLLMLPQAK